jgi:predicted transcriptional regulator
MSVLSTRVPREIKADLDELATSTGRRRAALVVEALRRFMEVERWQLADIEAGLREADAGEFASAAEVDALRGKYRAHRAAQQ